MNNTENGRDIRPDAGGAAAAYTVRDRVVTVFTVILSIIPLLAVISFIMWRVMRSRGRSDRDIAAAILKTHLIIVAAVLVLAIIISAFATTSPGERGERDAWICATDVVSERLKSPDSADFCSFSEAQITSLGGGRWRVSGYVDADNSLGVSVRSTFTVTLTLTDDGYKNAECEFDP